MFTVNQLVGFGAIGADGLSVTYLGNAKDAADLTTYSFTSKSLGAAAADRYILVAIADFNNNGFGSGSVGGVSATHLLSSNVASIGLVHFMIAAVPTGTTGTIGYAPASGTSSNCAIDWWRLTNLKSTTLVHSAKTTTSGGSLATNVSAGGALFGAASMRDGVNIRHAAAWRSFGGAESSHAITATLTSGTCFTGIDEEHNTLVETSASGSGITAGVISLR